MKNSETKRCHFVPITYLEKFYQNENKKKVLVARPKLGGKTFNPTPTNICVRKHFYSDNIENNYNRVYNILNKSKNKRLTGTERELIISTIITLLFRNPFILDRFNEFWSDSIDRLYGLSENTSTRSFQIDDKTIKIDDIPKQDFLKANKDQNKDIFNITHIKFALRLIEIRFNDCISVTEIEDEHEYITSDNPVTISNPNTRIGSIFDPTNYLRLPINTKKCLVLYPTGTNDFDPRDIYRRKVKSTSALLDSIYVNKLQHFYSNGLLIGSYKSFRSLEKLLNKTAEEIYSLSIQVSKEMHSEYIETLRKKIINRSNVNNI